VAVPIAPFRGALDWPVTGRISGRFGQPGRGGAGVRNGVEIAAPEGTSVHAVHAGTVSYADAFTGFGNLVIVDHGGNNYTLYGYLDSIQTSRGDPVEAGTELGRVGSAPAGPSALYFEVRIDGRSVDPVQWLRAR
jgi:septal ring factor EnvC (AmiA/AmiB activator)